MVEVEMWNGSGCVTVAATEYHCKENSNLTVRPGPLLHVRLASTVGVFAKGIYALASHRQFA
jgi:hypothetical protein